jgi:hypothetical protein
MLSPLLWSSLQVAAQLSYPIGKGECFEIHPYTFSHDAYCSDANPHDRHCIATTKAPTTTTTTTTTTTSTTTTMMTTQSIDWTTPSPFETTTFQENTTSSSANDSTTITDTSDLDTLTTMFSPTSSTNSSWIVLEPKTHPRKKNVISRCVNFLYVLLKTMSQKNA